MSFSSQEPLVIAVDMLYEMGKCSQCFLFDSSMDPKLNNWIDKNPPGWEGEDWKDLLLLPGFLLSQNLHATRGVLSTGCSL